MKQVAIITGAGRGIGRATAILLAAKGYRVALIARTESDLRETAALIGPLPEYRKTRDDDPLIMPLDVTQPEAVAAAIATVVKHFGRIDVIVNSVGLAPLLSIEQTTPAIWQEVLETNLSAVHYMCHAVWPIFKQQHHGVIANISSESARDPFEGFSAYGSAKAGLNLLGKALAREGAAIGVRVHAIAPAAVETGMFRKLLTPEQFSPEHTLAPEDIAKIAAQCIEGDLVHTSGEVIYVHKQPS